MAALINNNRKQPYSELGKTSKMELFTNIVHCIQPLTIFAKHSMLVVSHSRCASDKTKEKPGVLSFISQKNECSNLWRFLPLANSCLYSQYHPTVRHY